MKDSAILLVISAILFLNSNALSDTATEALGGLILEIAMRYFSASKCVVTVTEDKNNILDYIQSLDVTIMHVQIPFSTLKASERLTPETEFEEYVWDNLLLEPMDSGCLAFIVQTGDIRFVVKTFARLARTPKSTHRANRRYLYLPTQDMSDSEFESYIGELFAMKEMDFMPDLVVARLVIQQNLTSDLRNTISGIRDNSENITVELITHTFVGFNPSERLSLDMWGPDTGFLRGVDLFPNKVTNLMGKEITLTAIFYPPYSALFEKGNISVFDGIEFQFMQEWAKENNFTFKVLYKPEEWWGEIWNNGSGVGLSGHVSMDQADVAFGAIYLWENEHHYTDYSTVYFRASLTIVHPKPHLLPGWQVIISPFNIGMWIAIGGSVIGATTALYVTSTCAMLLLTTPESKLIVNMYSTWVECTFRIMGLLVLQVPPDERDYSTPRFVPMRHLVTWLILFFFVVTTAYCSGLASVLTLPRYEKPIDSPADMVELQAKWGAMDECFVFFLRESLDSVMLTMAKNFILEDEEYFTSKVRSGDLGFAIEKLQNGHFALPPYVNEETMHYLRLMKEDYVTAHCVFMLRKGSPYMNTINTMIGKLRDRGVILYWEDLVVRNYMSTRDQLAVTTSQKEEDTGPQKLQLRHAMGSFYILLYGHIISLLVFSLELTTHKYQQSRCEEENKFQK